MASGCRMVVAAALAVVFVLAGCETVDTGASQRQAMQQAIRNEPPGNYFVGRRMYKRDYKVWGWVREPGKPWKSARLVMLNEQQLLAPDRARDDIGSDNGHEYRLTGRFTGEQVYEPASDGFYPEFLVTGFQVLSTNPPNIYKQARQNDPKVRILMAPVH